MQKWELMQKEMQVAVQQEDAGNNTQVKLGKLTRDSACFSSWEGCTCFLVPALGFVESRCWQRAAAAAAPAARGPRHGAGGAAPWHGTGKGGPGTERLLGREAEAQGRFRQPQGWAPVLES